MLSKVSDTAHVSGYLANFADDSLDLKERSDLALIIDQLFIDLKDGHSCSYLKRIAQTLKFKDIYILDILKQSGLVKLYETCPEKLQAKPISILINKKDTLIYISKYLQYELDIITQVAKCQKNYAPATNDIFAILEDLQINSGLPNEAQLLAIKAAQTQKLSIITGGPGTGKTTAVTLLLWLFYTIYGLTPKIKICAPTGKAAIRVRQSIENCLINLETSGLNIDRSVFDQFIADPKNFGTIHKLLGYRDKSIYFKHDKTNPVDVDILIIDESSMVGLPLFSKLLQALDMGRLQHIILLGDKNQLSSVEEGYVFASLVDAGSESNSQKIDLFNQDLTKSFVSELSVSNRNLGDVGVLANAILNNDNELISTTLNHSTVISMVDISKINLSAKNYINAISSVDKVDLDLNRLFSLYNKTATLCLTNVGKYGTENLNLTMEKHIKKLTCVSDEWYDGRAIIILENDYSLGLYNGDIGICLVLDGVPELFFANGKKLIPEILPKYALAYAITVHKSQGSEYENVNLVLCDNAGLMLFNGLLTKELVYTGITRAKESITIYAGDKVLMSAINNQTIRNTGLNFMLESRSCINH